MIDAELFRQFELAERLGMTRAQLLAEMTTTEFAAWQLYDIRRAQLNKRD